MPAQRRSGLPALHRSTGDGIFPRGRRNRGGVTAPAAPLATHPVAAAADLAGIPTRAGRRADVTAVLVAHDGARWLPEVLAALRALTVSPRRLVAVDTGSGDDTPILLAAVTGDVVDRVLTLPRDTGFGAAVAAALEIEVDAAGGPAEFLWLLHDDCAPEADTLDRLLQHAADSPSTALLGPKVRDWADPRFLVEVGVTTDTAGHRETGLERREYDQGQHDGVRDVLAVGTAGALIRRTVWDMVGGLDPALPVFRDDLDLGWRVNAAGHRVAVVPSARVRHARAATTGRRPLDAARGRAEGIDRRHALHVLLSHAPAPRLPLLVLRLVLATVLRVLGFVLTRQVLQARDELAAAAHVGLHPRRLRQARRVRRASRAIPARALRPLFASRRGRARVRLEALGDWLSGAGAAGDQGSQLDLGGDEPDAFVADPDPRRGLLRDLLSRPPVVLVLGLALLTAVAERGLLPFGGGLLAGGRLLPAPDGARALWQAYLTGWHPISVGSDLPGSPAVGVLAALATLLLGKAWLAVDVLLLASVPLSAATAYAAAAAVVRHRVLRVWAAATWALLPVATAAVAAGRLDAAAVQVVLPLVLLSGARLLSQDPGAVGWRRAWALGLGLTLTAALSPVLWPVAAVLLLGGAGLRLVLAGRGQRAAARRTAGAALLATAVAPVLLLPWSPAVASDPGRLLYGPGRIAGDPELVDAALPAWQLFLLSPGGAGLPAVWMTAGLLVAGLAGLLRVHRGRLPLGAWLLALTGFGLALGLALAAPTAPSAAPGSPAGPPVWPGAGLQIAAAGVLLAALVAAEGARTRLTDRDFGWRQLLAGLVVVAAALTPLLTAGEWLRDGAAGPVRRTVQPVLPAFARAELAASPGLRVLALQPTAGRVGYDLSTGDGSRLGSTETPPGEQQARLLDDVVADLLTPSGSDAAAALATRAVRYVALPAASAGDLPPVLDAQEGLTRRSGTEVLLWEVVVPTARLTVLGPEVAEAARTGARGPALGAPLQPLSDGRLAPGPAGRLLVLAEAADPGWLATLNGQPLPRATAWGWAAAFALPEEGGELRVRHEERARRVALVLQGVALLLVLVLAAPGARPRHGLEPADALPGAA